MNQRKITVTSILRFPKKFPELRNGNFKVLNYEEGDFLRNLLNYFYNFSEDELGKCIKEGVESKGIFRRENVEKKKQRRFAMLSEKCSRYLKLNAFLTSEEYMIRELNIDIDPEIFKYLSIYIGGLAEHHKVDFSRANAFKIAKNDIETRGSEMKFEDISIALNECIKRVNNYLEKNGVTLNVKEENIDNERGFARTPTGKLVRGNAAKYLKAKYGE